MRPHIYIGIYRGHSLLSWYIKTFTWSTSSHISAFRPPDELGRFGHVIEAWRKGVTEQHWTQNHSPGTIIDVYQIPCEQWQYDIFYAEMSRKKGARYDFLGILGFRVRANIHCAAKWFCSEAVYDSMVRAGLNLLGNIEPHKVFPGMFDLINEKQWVTRLIVPKG